MALTREDIQTIASLLDTKLKPIEQRLDNIETDVSTLKTDISEIKDTINKNYGILEEFYVYQKEHNTEVSNSLAIVGVN